MRIAVCDEEQSVLVLVRQYFSAYDIIGGFETIDYFGNVEELLISLKDNAYDVFLLGVRLEGIWSMGKVIKLRTGDRLPIAYEVFRRELTLVWMRHTKATAPYIGYFNRNSVVLELKDIYYLESSQRVTYVQAKESKYRVNGTLDKEAKKLPAYRFVRISQGELVNLSHVKSIQKDRVFLDNGEVKYTSVRRTQETREKWEFYHKNFIHDKIRQ